MTELDTVPNTHNSNGKDGGPRRYRRWQQLKPWQRIGAITATVIPAVIAAVIAAYVITSLGIGRDTRDIQPGERTVKINGDDSGELGQSIQFIGDVSEEPKEAHWTDQHGEEIQFKDHAILVVECDSPQGFEVYLSGEFVDGKPFRESHTIKTCRSKPVDGVRIEGDLQKLRGTKFTLTAVIEGPYARAYWTTPNGKTSETTNGGEYKAWCLAGPYTYKLTAVARDGKAKSAQHTVSCSVVPLG